MRQPDQVHADLRDRFDNDYPDWARGRGSWPLRIPLHPPSTRQRADDPIGCHTWAATWTDYPGPGRVVYTSLRFPTGSHPMPKTLVLTHPTDVAAVHPDCRTTWEQCGQRLVELQTAFPDATFPGTIRKITNLSADDYKRLFQAVSWLRANPTSGLLVRQLPIEGIDTKWLERHSHLVLAMLGHVNETRQDNDDDTTIAGASPRKRLHRRLGLRLPPELIQVAVLDARLRAQLGGMRHFAASVDDLNRWPGTPSIVIILENKETGYALADDIDGAVAFHGNGFNVATYADITWIRAATSIIYWGDIDAPGLQSVNDLRAYGIAARTVLMDLTTLDTYRHLTTDGAGPQRAALPYLTDSEQELFTHLTDHAKRNPAGLLLEQERIPWPHAYQRLITALKTETDATRG